MNKRLFLIICCIVWLVSDSSYARSTNSENPLPRPEQYTIRSLHVADTASIDFRRGSDLLYGAFLHNQSALNRIRQLIEQHQAAIRDGNGHLRLTSIIPISERNNIRSLNLASIRGAVIRQWAINQYPWLKKTSFTFFIDIEDNRNAVTVLYQKEPIINKENCEIYFSLHKYHPEKVDYALAQYSRIPFADGSLLFEKTGIDFLNTDLVTDTTLSERTNDEKEEQVCITIYYRWDKDNLDPSYLTNQKTLQLLDSLFTQEKAKEIDSIKIAAYASPEGPPLYNKRLSQRRADTLKKYLSDTYPLIRNKRIITDARGENWEGFIKLAEADTKLPMREQVLTILLDQTLNNTERQNKIRKLDKGKLYDQYILPNYYRYLRNGASMFIVYYPVKKTEEIQIPADNASEPIEIILTEPEAEVPVSNEKICYPAALRTNLLYDAAGALNLGIEIPFGSKKNWSYIADMAYAFWRSPNNRFALQTLEYGSEIRYWFSQMSEKQQIKPLQGWNVGVYGRYWQRYDIQWIDGYQGDGSWSAGVTAGYSFEIARQLCLEASLGGGWFATTEYRHYHQPQYDEKGKYHLMWQKTGRWSGLSLTKIRFSLVWILQYKKREGVR